MSWQDDVMIEQEQADALWYMGEAEWRDMYKDKEEEEILKRSKRAEYNKRWREKHPEQMKKINRENAANWRAKNRDKYNAYHKDWYRSRSATIDKSK